MQTLRQQHESLESQTAQRFSELLKEREQGLVIVSEDENYDDCEMVDVYDEVNGSTYSIYVVGITKGGMIEGIDVNDEVRRDEYRLSDLASLLDRINIVEILEYQDKF
jgi:hypothetical protein